MNPPVLLAKSALPGRPTVTLEAHLADTATAARALFRPGSRLRERWLRFFRVGPAGLRRFEPCLEVAALLHDLGKANAEFLAAVQGSGRPQTLRHEHISALVLCLPEVRGWLAASPTIDVDVVTAAVLSHHFKADDKGDYRWCQPRHASTLALYLDHPEVVRTLERVAAAAGLGPPPRLNLRSWSGSAPWTDAFKAGMTHARAFQRSLLGGESDRRALLAAVKTAVVIADAASSGLVREGHPISLWIEETLHGVALTPEAIEEAILSRRATAIARARGGFRYHAFQELAGEQGPRALLLAACGAGKTLAAWRWVANIARTQPVGSVIFLYPTRGTATEGFRDYVGWAPEAEAALVHGTSRYEIERILENPPEALVGKRPLPSEAEARLFSLGLWSKRYFSATVDQFLAFLEHGYSSTCLLPRLVDSAVVIDEVHSFDRQLFDTLIAFLRSFDVPVLCMTATLGPTRRQELVDAGLVPFPREEHRGHLQDLEAAESHPRYRINFVSSESEAFVRALAAARDGKRVLWVCNTVARCQVQSQRFAEALAEPPISYHSRFRLKDRQRHHARTVEAFQRRGAIVAVTTQVCEMSLDLDADVLVTEIAPVSSLVQRFGRANRHARAGDPARAEVMVIDVPSALPYEAPELTLARAFVQAHEGHDVSQRALADSLDRFSVAEATAAGSARLFESGYFAVPGSLRDVDDGSGAAVLDSDVAAVLAARAARRPYDELVLPAPRSAHVPRTEAHAALPPYLGVVAADNYDERLGLLVETSR